MGVAFADAAGVISDANAALAKFFGASQSLAGKNFATLVEPGEQAQVMDLIARAARGETGLKAVELRGQKSGSGEDRMAELFATPLHAGKEPRSFSICWMFPNRRRWKPNSPSRRKCRRWASWRAAWRMTSTTC